MEPQGCGEEATPNWGEVHTCIAGCTGTARVGVCRSNWGLSPSGRLPEVGPCTPCTPPSPTTPRRRSEKVVSRFERRGEGGRTDPEGVQGVQVPTPGRGACLVRCTQRGSRRGSPASPLVARGAVPLRQLTQANSEPYGPRLCHSPFLPQLPRSPPFWVAWACAATSHCHRAPAGWSQPRIYMEPP